MYKDEGDCKVAASHLGIVKFIL